ncbi:MAG: helix-turn-helix domain-containing protein [Candidatus Nanoarchaeia archaeon]|nr:helix-turn-helix domain-containing protein [Candidatus Nanoarchaeia archaeon]
MWTTKIKLKHDCIIGTRCKKFGVIDAGISFNIFQEKGVTYSPQIHTVYGEPAAINNFIKDIKKDKRIENFEIAGDSFFCLEVRKEHVPSTFKTDKLIFVKPVFVDREGYETWEVASWNKFNLTEFIKNLKKDFEDVKVLNIQQTKLTDVYYPHLMPDLTPSQKRAIGLAIENGYYDFPKKTNMKKLARIVGVSAPTFCEHLSKAEKKIIPNVLSSTST